MQLSALRYTAECYSQLSLIRVAFFISGNDRESVMLEFQDKGKFTPSDLDFINLTFTIKHQGEEDFQVCAFTNENQTIDFRRSSEFCRTDVSTVLQVEKQDFEKLFNYLRKDNNKEQNLLIVFMDCKINNIMNVTTHIRGEVSLQSGGIIQAGAEFVSDKEKVIFSVIDHFIKTQSCKYTGKIY